MDYSKVICDLTNPYASEKEIEMQLNRLKSLSLRGVLVSPFWAKKVVRDLSDSPIFVQSYAGSIEGNQLSQTKIFSAQQLQKVGVHEIISTINIAALRTNKEWCKLEAFSISEAAHKKENLHILRLPQCELTDSEIEYIIHLCNQTGIDSLFLQPLHLKYYSLIKEVISSTIELQIVGESLDLFEEELKEKFDTVILSYEQLFD